MHQVTPKKAPLFARAPGENEIETDARMHPQQIAMASRMCVPTRLTGKQDVKVRHKKSDEGDELHQVRIKRTFLLFAIIILLLVTTTAATHDGVYRNHTGESYLLLALQL